METAAKDTDALKRGLVRKEGETGKITREKVKLRYEAGLRSRGTRKESISNSGEVRGEWRRKEGGGWEPESDAHNRSQSRTRRPRNSERAKIGGRVTGSTVSEC